MTERKEAVRADAQRLRTDAAMLNSLADTFRIIANGGYILAEAGSGSPAVIIIATGSEVQIALAAR